MMHAAAARQRGYQVVQLEREAGSRGATVRNFGLVWVSGRSPGGRRSRSRQAPYATTAVPGTAGRVRLAPQRPAAADAGAQLLLAQRLDGSLTIGDTHAYDEPFAFDVDEAPYHHCAPGLSSCSGRRCRRRGGGGPAYTAR